MAEAVEATTITRMFDPTIWGLRKNQLVVFFAAAGITALYLILKVILFNNSLFFSVPGGAVVIASWLFFMSVGLNRDRLYQFERRVWFMFSMTQGDELIQKYSDKDELKTRNFSHIKNIFKGGQTEFHTDAWGNGKSNNWGTYLKLFAYSPESLDVFFSNAERTLSSVPDGTIIKTILEARRSTGDPAAPFRKELKKEKLHPVIREICYEQIELCQNSNSKTYVTHLAFIIPYETNRKEAFKTLESISYSIHKVLKEMEIESERLDTPEKVDSMFDGMITHNLHIVRRSPE